MYSDQTNSAGVNLAVACAAVCLFCGLVEIAMFCFHARGASMLELALTEVGAVTALGSLIVYRRRTGTTVPRGEHSILFREAMTDGEKVLLARLRTKPIAVVEESDGWRPAGSLPHSVTPADFDAVIRDGFASVDSARGLLRKGRG